MWDSDLKRYLPSCLIALVLLSPLFFYTGSQTKQVNDQDSGPVFSIDYAIVTETASKESPNIVDKKSNTNNEQESINDSDPAQLTMADSKEIISENKKELSPGSEESISLTDNDQFKSIEDPIQNSLPEEAPDFVKTNTQFSENRAGLAKKTNESVPDREELQRWQTEVLEKIGRNKIYPYKARKQYWEGSVLMSVTIDKNGKLLETTIMEHSGHTLLDESSIKTVKRAEPFPASPEKTSTIVFSMVFRLE